jgi:hypothetical protein
MGNICNILSIISKTPLTLNEEDNSCNYSNKKNYLPSLDISNAIILNNSNDYIEPPSYREVRDEGSIFYKKTMLFNGFSDTLIPKPRL